MFIPSTQSRKKDIPKWAWTKNESHEFAIPKIPKNRRIVPKFEHMPSPSLAIRLAHDPLVDPKIAELAIVRADSIAQRSSRGQSVELA